MPSTTPDTCGASDKADDLYEELIAGLDTDFPELDLDSDEYKLPSIVDNPLYEPVNTLALEQLTEGTIEGSGVFDGLMRAVSTHLEKEYNSGRITGREYSDVYTGSIQSALGTAVQFLLGKEQAYWSALLVQGQAKAAEAQAVIARLGTQTAKLEAFRTMVEAKSSILDQLQKKLSLSLLDIEYCLKIRQKESLDMDIASKVYSNTNFLPIQKLTLEAQKSLVDEQIEVQRAQTLNNRTDGSPVAGVLGKQKDLYTQQIDSYKRDAETKAAKMFLDSWVTQKTMDEGLIAPNALQNASIDTVMNRIKSLNGLT